MAKRYWLFKTDPESFAFEDLKKSPGQKTYWNGVRNYQARNFLRDDMSAGDGVLFYHSQVTPPFVAGTAKIVKAGYPDFTQFDATSDYYDDTSDPKNPRWYLVDIQFDREFKAPVSIDQLRKHPLLKDMVLLKKGSRLSIQPVTAEEWHVLLSLGGLA